MEKGIILCITLILILFIFVIGINGCKKDIEGVESFKKIPELCPNLVVGESIALLPPEVLPQFKSVGVSDEFISYTTGAFGGYGSTTFKFYLDSKIIVISQTRADDQEMKKGDEGYETQFNLIVASLKDSLNEEHIKGTEQEERLELIIECLENNY